MSNTTRRWSDDKANKNLTKGKWNEKEIQHLKRLLCKYAARKKLSPDQLESLCSDTTPSEFEGVWTKLAKYFPNRSVQSVHNACKRNFNPYNYKGEWTVKEEKILIDYVQANGNKWKELGELLQRTALNVKDKWKQMGGARRRLRKTGPWNIEETIELVRLVFLNLSLPCIIPEEFDKKQEDASLSKLLNLIEQYKKKLKRKEINWEAISEVFQTRSSVDCRTRWSYIMNFKIPERMTFTNEEDIAIFKAIRKQNVNFIEDIDYSKIDNGKFEDDNKFRFRVLAKAMSGRLELSLNEILDKLEYSYNDAPPVESSLVDYYI